MSALYADRAYPFSIPPDTTLKKLLPDTRSIKKARAPTALPTHAYRHLPPSDETGAGATPEAREIIKESRIPSPIQISIIASVLRPNVPNTPILSVDQPQN